MRRREAGRFVRVGLECGGKRGLSRATPLWLHPPTSASAAAGGRAPRLRLVARGRKRGRRPLGVVPALQKTEAARTRAASVAGRGSGLTKPAGREPPAGRTSACIRGSPCAGRSRRKLPHPPCSNWPIWPLRRTSGIARRNPRRTRSWGPRRIGRTKRKPGPRRPLPPRTQATFSSGSSFHGLFCCEQPYATNLVCQKRIPVRIPSERKHRDFGPTPDRPRSEANHRFRAQTLLTAAAHPALQAAGQRNMSDKNIHTL